MVIVEPGSENYAAEIVQIEHHHLRELEGLDNLRGVNLYGLQALVSKDTTPGLYVMLPVESVLSLDFARKNNLHRDPSLNADETQTGYLERNRRVRALRLRGHLSSAILLPVASLNVLFPDGAVPFLEHGVRFTHLNGVEVCRKYVVPTKTPRGAQKPAESLSAILGGFPEHKDTANFARAREFPETGRFFVSQKLHGTSARFGVLPCQDDTRSWWQKLLRFPVPVKHKLVVGSRRVTKSVDLGAVGGANHWYGDDVWTQYAADNNLKHVIPKDHIIFGEIVGWSRDGKPIQKGYTYECPRGQSQLYVYRVAVLTSDGTLIDYSWEGVAEFCKQRGLLVVPHLARASARSWIASAASDVWLDRRLRNLSHDAVMLSDRDSVDEGVVIRSEEPTGPTFYKLKSPKFLEYETKQLDAELPDIEEG